MSEPPSKRRRVDVYRSSRPQGDYRSVGHPFSVLPVHVVLDILREFYILEVTLERFHREMFHGKCQILRAIDGEEEIDSIMNQSDYFGWFAKDRTRTVWQLFYNLWPTTSIRTGMDRETWDDEATAYMEHGMHFYFPHDVRYLKLIRPNRLQVEIGGRFVRVIHIHIYKAILKTAQNFPKLRVIHLGYGTCDLLAGINSELSHHFPSLERCMISLTT